GGGGEGERCVGERPAHAALEDHLALSAEADVGADAEATVDRAEPPLAALLDDDADMGIDVLGARAGAAHLVAVLTVAGDDIDVAHVQRRRLRRVVVVARLATRTGNVAVSYRCPSDGLPKALTRPVSGAGSDRRRRG